MLVGHYAPAFILKRHSVLPLWTLFLAVQFPDVVCFTLVLLGVEQINLLPDRAGFLMLDLAYMPFSHSLAANVLMSGFMLLIGLAVRRMRDGAILAIASLSHWFCDLLVHTPDLPLLTARGTKLGFGLWTVPWASLMLEIALLCLAYWYNRRHQENPRCEVILILILIFAQICSTLMLPLMGNAVKLAWTSLATYGVMATLAYTLVDRPADAK